jgi:hypothetical protein
MAGMDSDEDLNGVGVEEEAQAEEADPNQVQAAHLPAWLIGKRVVVRCPCAEDGDENTQGADLGVLRTVDIKVGAGVQQRWDDGHDESGSWLTGELVFGEVKAIRICATGRMYTCEFTDSLGVEEFEMGEDEVREAAHHGRWLPGTVTGLGPVNRAHVTVKYDNYGWELEHNLDHDWLAEGLTTKTTWNNGTSTLRSHAPPLNAWQLDDEGGESEGEGGGEGGGEADGEDDDEDEDDDGEDDDEDEEGGE